MILKRLGSSPRRGSAQQRLGSEGEEAMASLKQSEASILQT